MSSLVVAVEVDDTVRVREGGVLRQGKVVDKLGGLYKVQYADGHLPTEEFLDERSFISDAEIQRKQREDHTGRFYQAIGRALGMAAGLGLLLFLVWYLRRKNRPSGDVVEAEIVESDP